MKPKLKAHWVIKLGNEAKLHVGEGNVVDKGDRVITIQSKNIKVFNDNGLTKFQRSVWDQINNQFAGKFLNQGDMLFTGKGLFPTKVLVPSKGLFLGIDEFGNLHMEVEEGMEKDIMAPVRSVISKIDNDKMVLEFDAIEFDGKGVSEGKAWGESDLRVIQRIPELNYKNNGQVILSTILDQPFLRKSDVLGVTAIVTNTKDDDFAKMETSLPILLIDDDDWNELIEFGGETRQVLVNTKSGRLLIVVE
jgi:hypothetical protein